MVEVVNHWLLLRPHKALRRKTCRCVLPTSLLLQWSKPQGLWLFTPEYWGVTSNVPILQMRKCNPVTDTSPRRTCENRRLCRRSGSSTTITEGQRRSNDEGGAVFWCLLDMPPFSARKIAAKDQAEQQAAGMLDVFGNGKVWPSVEQTAKVPCGLWRCWTVRHSHLSDYVA